MNVILLRYSVQIADEKERLNKKQLRYGLQNYLPVD